MTLIPIKTDPTRRELRMFACLWVPLFCGVLGFILYQRNGDSPVPNVLWAGAALTAIIGALAPAAIKPLFVGLMVLMSPIGWVVSHLMLGFIYYLIITPLGFLLRLVGWDPMERRFERDTPSYWSAVGDEKGTDSYFKQF